MLKTVIATFVGGGSEEQEPLDKVVPDVWVDRMQLLDELSNLVAKNIDKKQQKQAANSNRSKRAVENAVETWVLRQTHYLSDAAVILNAKLALK